MQCGLGQVQHAKLERPQLIPLLCVSVQFTGREMYNYLANNFQILKVECHKDAPFINKIGISVVL